MLFIILTKYCVLIDYSFYDADCQYWYHKSCVKGSDDRFNCAKCNNELSDNGEDEDDEDEDDEETL